MEDNFSIDWSNPMAMFHNDHHHHPPQHVNAGEEADGDGNHFRGPDSNLNGQTQPGALEQKAPQSTAVAASHMSAQGDDAAMKQKLENQRRAEVLRAKLIAVRQNTPIKPSTPVPTTTKAPVDAIDSSEKAPAIKVSHTQQPQQQQSKTATPQQKEEEDEEEEGEVKPTHKANEIDFEDLEALLAAGKAHADAQTAAAQHTKEMTHVAPSTGNSPGGPRDTEELELFPAKRQQLQQQHSSTDRPRVADLADVYYTDLVAWLEMTGYHDVEYRESKLRTYKERRALEDEAARIAEKLEKLRQAEQTEMQLLRMGTPGAKAPSMAPPPLPLSMVPPVNGVKRARSPEQVPAEKRQREDDGFRVRSGKELPDQHQVFARRPRSPTPASERRGSYPDATRRSIDDRGLPGSRSRDPSLERRSQYYRRDDDLRYDYFAAPRQPAPREPRSSYGNGSGVRPGWPHGREMDSNSRPSAGLDLKKGGVRYFMIKSWNHDNVYEAQRTNVWATQEKNEEMLTHAYKTSRHVILLFSVNKSMAFQGYALMTSAPDPDIQKPSFTRRLNWATSNAFTLQWLAKTPIDFQLVGHLKNTFNIDEDTGEAHAVLVGRDGQEINADAGMGVLWFLDEAEAEAEAYRKSGKGNGILSWKPPLWSAEPERASCGI